jgi:RNA polymerase sigma factor (sigma-70 family)
MCSDGALAERFAAGDESAFGVLHDRHRASVLAVCIGVLGSVHDAEDATQETFAALAVALRTAPPRELRAWLARVGRNAAIDVARRRRTRAFADFELPDDGGAAIDGVTASHGLKVELESVISGIKELPEAQRTALLMRELAGHSYAEIADLLGSDEAAVRGLIARARIGLRAHRDASELPCAAAREAMAAEPDGRRYDRTVRRHVRGCASCRAYRRALRDDARALRGLVPLSGGGFAGGGAMFGGLAAKGALLGATASQITAACAVSVCAVGGIVLIAPPGHVAHRRSAGATGARHAVSVHSAPRSARSHRVQPTTPPIARALAAQPSVSAGSGAAVSTAGSVSYARARIHSAPSVTVPGSFTAPSASTVSRTGSRTGSGTGSRTGSVSPLSGSTVGSDPAPSAPAVTQPAPGGHEDASSDPNLGGQAPGGSGASSRDAAVPSVQQPGSGGDPTSAMPVGSGP